MELTLVWVSTHNSATLSFKEKEKRNVKYQALYRATQKAKEGKLIDNLTNRQETN